MSTSKTTTSEPAKQTVTKADQTFLFGRENYMWMIGGLVLILIGFMLMAGGKSPDPHKFNYDEIYSFRRITLAPIVVLAGFVVEVFAIMKKPKDNQ
ncbi:MAG: DUF3098 domain-containing protein [Bacteroidota bacterium]